MNILAIDCSANLCAACLYETDTGAERSRVVLDIGKGHAEHLMAVIADAMRQADVRFPDLGALAVSVGPGSFTGIRVAVSAARGFALALDIPAVGISTLEAIAAAARAKLGARSVFAALLSGADHVQAAGYDALGAVWQNPAVMTIGRAAEIAKQSDAALAGTAARRLVAAPPGWSAEFGVETATADIAIYARLAVSKGFSAEKPRPLYLREPDAKPQAGFILPRAVKDGSAPEMKETEPEGQ